MKDIFAALFVVATLLATVATASADTLTASLGEPLREVSHAVRLDRDDGVARFRVRRTFANAGTRSDEAVVTVDLPAGAAATALRIRVGQRWYDGELMEAEKAADIYLELTGMGPHAPRDPALLSWVWPDRLELRVFPVPPGGTATVEYTLTVPTTYQDGVSMLTYPLADPIYGLADPVLTVDASAGVGVRIDEQPVAAEQPVVLRAAAPDPRHTSPGLSSACIALVEEPTTRIEARLGRVSLKGADASRLEVDLPAKLSTMPSRPHVVFVLDASRSAGEEGLEEQRRLVAGFLQHVPDASVELLVYRRQASALFGEFVVADEVESRWDQARKAGLLTPGNGSNLDAALKLAYELVGKQRGDRYVVAFTDDRLRPSWPSKLSLGTRPDDSVTTHMLVLGGNSSGLARDDDHRLAAIPREDGGILVHTGGTVDLEAESFEAETLHLVRPTRIDDASIDGFEIADVLREGSSIREMELSATSRSLRLRGKLWAKRVAVAPRKARSFDRATAAWVFSHNLHGALTPEQMLAFAMHGRAVTPVTSYLAIEPGVRPSTEGLPWNGSGGLGLRGAGYGGGGSGLARLGTAPPNLRDLLEPAATTCRAVHPGGTVVLAVHTTLIELVDVELRSSPGPLATCVLEAAWELALPSGYSAVPASSQEVSL